MKTRVVALVVFVAVVLSACAPAVTIHPKEYVTNLSFPTAYEVTVKTINTEPYTSNTGGWVITQSDQVGGFVTAQLNGLYKCGLFVGCHPDPARVSVTLVKRSDGTTTVSISSTAQDQAKKLVADLIEALKVTPAQGSG